MNDLTKGKPIAVILQFAIPLLIGSFFNWPIILLIP